MLTHLQILLDSGKTVKYLGQSFLPYVLGALFFESPYF